MTTQIKELNIQSSSLLLATNNSITLLAEPTDLDFARDGNNLAVTGADSTTTIIEGFFVEDEDGAQLPDFILPDGTIISSEDFLTAQNPDLDITTAAGPSSTSNSGGTNYSDNAGSSLDGVKTLGSLEATNWDTSITTPLLEVPTEMATVTIPSTSFIPTTPSITPPITPPLPPQPVEQGFFTRAVLYTDGNDAYRTESIKFGLVCKNDGTGKYTQLDANSGEYSYTVEDPTNSGYFVLPPVAGPDGLLLISLTQAGKEALAANPNALHTMLQVTVANGDYSVNNTYPMEIIIEKDDTYESAQQMSLTANDEKLAFQWHTIEREDMPDFTQPALLQSGDGEHIYTGDGNAYISVASSSAEIVQGKTTGNMITSGSGDDTIVINGGTENADYNSTWWAGIDAGNGDNTILFQGASIHAQVTTGSGDDYIRYDISNPDAYCGLYGGTLNSGNGNDTIEINSTSSGLMGVASTAFNLGSGDDIFTIKAATHGVSGSNINLGAGDDTMIIEAGTRGMSNGTLSLGAGNDVVSIISNGTAMGGGISAGAESGNKHITVAGKEYAFHDNYTNSIITGLGNDTILLGKGINVENDTVTFSANTEEQGWGNLTGNIQIASGNGSDVIAIDGDVHIDGFVDIRWGSTQVGSWYDNYISTGTGTKDISTAGSGTSNTLVINGNILGYDSYHSSNINIVGDAGKDTFDFKGSVNSANIKTGAGEDVLKIGGDISNTNIDMGNNNDIVHLNNATLDNLTTLQGGEGTDTLVYNLASNTTGLQSLVDAIANNQVQGFESLVLDMTNNTTNSLDLSSMLDTLHNTVGDGTNNKIFVNGDADDTIGLGNGWAQADGQTEQVNGINYNVFVHSNSDDTVYIEHTITSIIG